MGKISLISGVFLSSLFLSSCQDVPVSFGLVANGGIANTEGVAIGEESFSLCLNLIYLVDGQSSQKTECNSILSEKDGSFSAKLNWKAFYTKYMWEKNNAHSVSVSDYSVFVGGAPASSIEVKDKPTIIEIFNEPTSELKLNIRVSPIDLKAANIWHQAYLISNPDDRFTLMNDFLNQYSSKLTSDQVLNLASAVADKTDGSNNTTYYRDTFILSFYNKEKSRLSSDDRIKLAKGLEQESARKTVLDI